MTYLKDYLDRWQVQVAIILVIGLLGCSSLPRQGADPQSQAVPAEPDEAATMSEKITLSLNFEAGIKIRYQVTTEAVTAIGNSQAVIHGNASITTLPKASELSEVVFTQEILGPLPEDANTAIALITINQVKYIRTSPSQSDLIFDSKESPTQNSPFSKLIGQTYTIEINPLGYVPGVFNLRPARLAVRGPTPAHAAALELVSPTTIFPRHGFFSLPGPDVGSLTVGDRWRGVQQYTLSIPGTDMDPLGTHRFEKIYQLQSVKQQPVGTIAEIVFEGSPIPRKAQDDQPVDIPFLSCSYSGGGEFNLDTGRIEGYLEHLEVRMPLPQTESPITDEGGIIIATRSCWVQRLDPD
jgi:hypothetical protein